MLKSWKGRKPLFSAIDLTLTLVIWFTVLFILFTPIDAFPLLCGALGLSNLNEAIEKMVEGQRKYVILTLSMSAVFIAISVYLFFRSV